MIPWYNVQIRLYALSVDDMGVAHRLIVVLRSGNGVRNISQVDNQIRGYFVDLLNLEFVTEEVVRTLVGSIGLIAAAPISTGVTCLIAINQHRLGSLRRYLGPENLGGGYDKFH